MTKEQLQLFTPFLKQRIHGVRMKSKQCYWKWYLGFGLRFKVETL